MTGCAATGNSAKDDTIQQGVATETIVTMNATHGLASSIEAGDRLLFRGLDLCIWVHPKAAHAIVDHWSNDSHMELVVDVHGQVMEELLAPNIVRLATAVGLIWAILRVFLLLGSNCVVVAECFPDGLHVHAMFLGELPHVLVVLHEATALVVLAMPVDFLGGLAIEAQEEAGGVALNEALVLPHHACDVIATAELVAEALPIHVEQHAANSSEGLGSQELHLGIWLVWMHQTCWVHLDPLKVDGIRTNGHGHLQSIAGAMVTVGGWQVSQVGTVLDEQGVLGKVRSEATRADDHRSVLHESLASNRH